MSLNIKNERVHALAREAARATGKTQTGAIEEALERLLEEYRDGPVTADRRRRLDSVHAIQESWRNHAQNDGLDRIREVEDLYDPTTGLPA
ncbi:MAG: type II toxin-antitoxin system VapB family antitoxin [Microlunatus sp.]